MFVRKKGGPFIDYGPSPKHRLTCCGHDESSKSVPAATARGIKRTLFRGSGAHLKTQGRFFEKRVLFTSMRHFLREAV